MNRCIQAWLAAAALLCAGCGPDVHYTIILKSNGDLIDRQFTYSCVKTIHEVGQPDRSEFVDLSPEDIKRIEQYYPPSQRTERPPARVFTAQFRETLPTEIDNFGRHARYFTTLGELHIYGERFQGVTDLTAKIEAIGHGADHCTDILLAWFTSEMGKDPQFPTLKTFCDKTFRRDFRNLLLLAWVLNITPGENVDRPDTIARIALFLCERGYFAADDLPQWFAAVQDAGERQNPDRLFAGLQRLLADQLGFRGKPIPPLLAPFNDAAKLRASFENFLRATDDYKDLVKQIGGPPAPDGQLSLPSPYLVLLNCLAPLHRSPLFGPSADLSVELNFPPDTESNAVWKAEKNAFVWSATLDDTANQLPSVLRAQWETSYREAQLLHFGRVVLKGQPLAQYCLWFHGLAPADRQEWDACLDNLRPGPSLRGRIQNFRFKSDPPADQGTSRFDSVRADLLQALDLAEPVQPAAP